MKLVRVELECSKGTVRGIGMLYQRGNREWMGASEEGQIKGRVWNSWEVGVTQSGDVINSENLGGKEEVICNLESVFVDSLT